VAPITTALRRQFDIPADVQGVVITARGTGDNAPLRPGHVILRAGNRPVSSVADFQAAVAESQRAGRDSVFLLLRIPTGNQPFVLKLPKSE
jgi:serine protease Do